MLFLSVFLKRKKSAHRQILIEIFLLSAKMTARRITYAVGIILTKSALFLDSLQPVRIFWRITYVLGRVNETCLLFEAQTLKEYINTERKSFDSFSLSFYSFLITREANNTWTFSPNTTATQYHSP